MINSANRSFSWGNQCQSLKPISQFFNNAHLRSNAAISVIFHGNKHSIYEHLSYAECNEVCFAVIVSSSFFMLFKIKEEYFFGPPSICIIKKNAYYTHSGIEAAYLFFNIK